MHVFDDFDDTDCVCTHGVCTTTYMCLMTHIVSVHTVSVPGVALS